MPAQSRLSPSTVTLGLLVLLFSAAPVPAQDAEEYARLLPHIPPKEPAEALESFRFADEDLRIELVAAEPLLRDPMAMTFDPSGRLYVIEFPEYNQRYAEGGVREGDRGRVRLLEDTDDDGRMDESTVFADDLDFASAVFCWDGGIFLGMAPDVLYLKDTDGDGKADEREVVLTGFGREKRRAGQAPLNSFRWGPDNRIYISTNFSGGAIRSTAKPDAAPAKVRNRDVVLDPRTGTFEVTSGGGQHGMSFDDGGRRFVCQNSRPIKMMFYDDRYLAGNPWLSAPSPARDIAAKGKYTQLHSISEEEPWRVVRTRMRAGDEFDGPVEGAGGTAQVSGYFTAATGVTVYRGDALPDRYYGDVFTGEVANNLVYRAKLIPDGAVLTAKRAGSPEGPEFLASTDNWFRPVQMSVGPDGALYVADMYRFLIEGAKFLPPQVLEHLEIRAGAKRGRIYRITAGESAPERRSPGLGKMESEELAGLLGHPNSWHRETAARILYRRQDDSAVATIRRLARDGEAGPVARTQARHSLNGLDALEPDDVARALEETDPDALRHALRLAEPLAADHPELGARIVELTRHSRAGIRYQAAWSLGSVEAGGNKVEALTRLLAREGGDRWMRLAAFSAIRPGDAGRLFAALLEDESVADSKAGKGILGDLVEQIARSGHSGDVEIAARRLADLASEGGSLSRRLLRTLVKQSDRQVRSRIVEAGGAPVEKAIAVLLDRARGTANDREAKASARASAIGLLRYAEFSDFRKRVSDWLAPGQPPEVQRAAIAALGHFEAAAVGDLIVGAWPTLGPEAREHALETLLSRPELASRCLDAVESGSIGRGALGAARVKRLREFPKESVRERARDLLSGGVAENRAAVVEAYRAALKKEGDPERGRAVFRRACSACHRLEKTGNDIGATLQGIGESGAESILLNILDPNRDVKPDYLLYTVTTKEGKSHSGMIRSESANSLVLRRLDGTEIDILRNEVAELRGMGLSFMPNGLEAQVSVEQMADLLAYLRSVE